MKSLLSKILFIVSVLIFILAFGYTAFAAESYIEGDYTYTVSAGYANITAYTGDAEGALVVPSNLGGYQVISISTKAFANCNKLTSVTVPSGVRSIGSGAFNGCNSLTEIMLPVLGIGRGDNDVTGANDLFGYIFGTEGDNLTRQYYGSTSYKDYAIPSSLTKVTITDETVISYGAFSGCTNIREIILPSTATTIEGKAFFGCSSLEKADVPEGITKIYESVFEDCISLKQVTLPSTLTSLGKQAFKNCTALGSIVIPEKIYAIDENIFYNCTSLSDITTLGTISSAYTNAFYNTPFLNNYEKYEDGVLYLGTVVLKVQPDATSVALKEGTKTICSGAFDECTTIKKITVPDTVTLLPGRIFRYCMALEELTVPVVGTSRGDNAKATSPFGAIFDYNSYSLGSDSIRQDYNNNSGDYCYYLVPKTLKKVTITNETVVSYGAFMNCDMIEELVLPDTVGDIRRMAFTNCTSLKKVVLPSKYQSLTTGIFSGCTSLTDVVLPTNLTSIGDSVFYNCSSLEEISIPSGVHTISASAFSGCASLKTMVFPAALKTIGTSAFMGCTSLESVEMSPVLTSIGKSAFEDCVLLDEIYIPETVTTIYTDAFKNTKFTNTESNYTQGVLCKDGWAIACLDSADVISVADGTKYIATGAFHNKTNLAEATLPSTIVKIGEGAFAGCTSLKKLTLPFVGLTPGTSGDMYSVFGAIFERVSSQTGATMQKYGNNSTLYKYYKIPESITEVKIKGDYNIPYGAFYNCSNLEKITISKNVANIYSEAFSGCTALKEFVLPDNITEISKSAFANCSSLKKATLCNGITKINDSAFSGCTALEAPEFPRSLTIIGTSAYRDCTSIETLSIPETVKEIGSSAFRGCTSLAEITLPFIGFQKGGTGGSSQVFGYIFGYQTNDNGLTVPQYYKEGNVYYYYIPSSLKKVTVTDESVIPYGAFYGCDFIDEIIIEGTPETIDIAAFANFGGEVVDVTIKDKQVKYSEGEAFAGSPLVTLYGYSDSTSEAYADAYGVDFVAIDGGDTVYTWQKYRINSVYLKQGDSYIDGVPSAEFSVFFDITNKGGYANDMISVVFFTDQGAMSHLALAPINIPYGETGLVECKVDNRAGYADTFKIFMVNGNNLAPLTLVKNYR